MPNAYNAHFVEKDPNPFNHISRPDFRPLSCTNMLEFGSKHYYKVLLEKLNKINWSQNFDTTFHLQVISAAILVFCAQTQTITAYVWHLYGILHNCKLKKHFPAQIRWNLGLKMCPSRQL